MNLHNHQEPAAPPESAISLLDDQALSQALDEQRARVEAGERLLAAHRAELDGARRRLKALLDEQRRRTLALAGLAPAPEAVPSPRRRRGTTGMDALQGRDGIDPAAPFSSFHFFSLQRQEVLLQAGSEAGDQTIGFGDKDNGELLLARTFGQARALLAAGHALGRPGVPLQRQLVWYVEQRKAGRLRLDQLFVEPRLEEA